MMKRCLFIFLMLSAQINALDLKQAYQDGAQTGAHHANESIDLLKALDLNQFPGFEANLPQEHYYRGVTQKNTGLEADSQTEAVSNESGKAIHEGFSQRPLVQVNPETESMQKLNQIAENGDAIMHGQNTHQTTCSLKPKECQYSWQEKTCLESKGLGTLHCAKTLRVEVAPYTSERYGLYLRTSGVKRTPWKITVNLAQTNTCQQNKNPCYTVSKAVAMPTNCALVKVSITDAKGLVVVEQTASCANPSLMLSVGVCRSGRCNIPYTHSVTMNVEMKQAKEYWDDQCQHLNTKEQEGLCHITEPLICTEPNQTRIIDDIPLTRSCWKKRATYHCGDEGQNNCEALIHEGCEQTASVCYKEQNGHCVTYQQTYQCPLTQCTDNQLICGENAFCLDGACASHEYSPSNEEDFKKAMTTLSAVSDASKDFDGKTNFIFKGQKLECSNLMLGAKNCCRDSGWGIDLNLFHCSDLEKKLGHARENKLVVPTGEYCFNRKKFPGGSVCVEHHETFCVFQSKLARIVQEQGRRNQLHISFGKGKHSNCSGITPEQMQLIRFESINFSEVYNDLNNKLKKPDVGQTTHGITERLNQFYKQGDING